jgi:hypothetical protein
MSHVAANMVDIHAPIATRGTTYFADKNALKARTDPAKKIFAMERVTGFELYS